MLTLNGAKRQLEKIEGRTARRIVVIFPGESIPDDLADNDVVIRVVYVQLNLEQNQHDIAQWSKKTIRQN